MGKKNTPSDITGGAHVMKKVALRPSLGELIIEVHAHRHRFNQIALAYHLV